MVGLGTLVNVIAIIVGSILGLLLKGGIKDRFKEIMSHSCGLAVMFIGAAGVFEMIFSVKGERLSSGSTMLIVISLVLGGLIGELLNIEKGLDTLGQTVEYTQRLELFQKTK